MCYSDQGEKERSWHYEWLWKWEKARPEIKSLWHCHSRASISINDHLFYSWSRLSCRQDSKRTLTRYVQCHGLWLPCMGQTCYGALGWQKTNPAQSEKSNGVSFLKQMPRGHLLPVPYPETTPWPAAETTVCVCVGQFMGSFHKQYKESLFVSKGATVLLAWPRELK